MLTQYMLSLGGQARVSEMSLSSGRNARSWQLVDLGCGTGPSNSSMSLVTATFNTRTSGIRTVRNLRMRQAMEVIDQPKYTC